MSTAETQQPSASSHTYLLVPILLLFALLVIAVLRAPSLISNVGIGSAIIVAAPLILATYALTIIAMAGRAGVDLSIGPLMGFINVSMIQLYGAGVITSAVEFFVFAIAVGILYQILMGLIIVYIRVQPIIVALSGFLALVGLNLVILPRPGGVAPEWMMPWGLGTSIWSPVLAILVLATIAWFFLTRTAFFGHLRLMGSDERTAYSAGVRINIVRLGAHVIAGVYSALAALTFTSLISSGDPTQGTTYTLMAVTALVLGGTSLAGGRGSIIGSLLGALNIYLITYVLSTFSFGMVQSFVTDAAYGVVLVVSLLLTLALPRLPAGVRAVSPFAFFVLLGIIAFGVILYSKDELTAPTVTADSSGLMVLGAEPDDSGLTVLGGEPDDSGLTVLGGEPEDSGLTVLGAEPDDSGLTVLGGESEDSGLTVLGGDSGLTVLGGEDPAAEETGPKATPLVYAAIVIAIVVYLFYLLYRHASIFLVAFVGLLALMVLGLSLYEGLGSASSGMGMAMGRGPPPLFVFEAIEPAARTPSLAILGADAAAFLPPAVTWVLIAAGTILVGSFLILIAQPKVRAQIANTPLLFLLGLGVAVAGLIVYLNGGLSVLAEGPYVEVYGLLIVGALLFVASLPRVQSRVKNVSIVLLAILSVTAMVATFFAAGPDEMAGPGTAASQAFDGGVSAAVGMVAQVGLSEATYVTVFWVMLAGTALFIFTLPRVRERIFAYAAIEKGVKAFSYTGAFIVLFSIVVMGAMFYAADLPLWKLGVAIVAAVIVARYGWRFLRRYRGQGLFAALQGPGRDRSGDARPLGAER